MPKSQYATFIKSHLQDKILDKFLWIMFLPQHFITYFFFVG